MARTVNEIYTAAVNTLVANFSAVGITIDSTKWSSRNIMRLFCYSFAVSAAYIEQMQDSLKLSIETIASKTPSASALWIQAKMFLFQYSATTPQYVQLIDMIPQYPIVDESLQIITACAVSPATMPNIVNIKVAKTVSGSITKLEPTELAAAQSYINTIGDAGVKYDVISQDPDRIFIDADIYYTGQFATIQPATIAAVKTFLQNLSVTNFDGVIKITDIENVIRSVAGVNDVVIKNIRARAYNTSFPSAVYLVQNKTTLIRYWKAEAGYCDEENTSGSTFTDKFNFISE